MATERQVQETIARCISTMVFYHNSERSRKTEDRMIAEVQVIAGFVEELGFERGEAEERIIRPVELELIARYGYEVGPRMAVQFANAFQSLGVLKG